MSIEVRLLIWATVLGLIQLFAAAIAARQHDGLRWAAGPRDEPGAAPGIIGGRLERARANFMQTFAFFAAVVLIIEATGRHDFLTSLGAHLYFWARLIYVPIYAAGVPYIRSTIWGTSIIGLILMLWGAAVG